MALSKFEGILEKFPCGRGGPLDDERPRLSKFGGILELFCCAWLLSTLEDERPLLSKLVGIIETFCCIWLLGPLEDERPLLSKLEGLIDISCRDRLRLLPRNGPISAVVYSVDVNCPVLEMGFSNAEEAY